MDDDYWEFTSNLDPVEECTRCGCAGAPDESVAHDDGILFLKFVATDDEWLCEDCVNCRKFELEYRRQMRDKGLEHRIVEVPIRMQRWVPDEDQPSFDFS